MCCSDRLNSPGKAVIRGVRPKDCCDPSMQGIERLDGRQRMRRVAEGFGRGAEGTPRYVALQSRATALSQRRPPTEIEGLGQNLDEPPSDSATGGRSGRAVRRQFAFR